MRQREKCLQFMDILKFLVVMSTLNAIQMDFFSLNVQHQITHPQIEAALLIKQNRYFYRSFFNRLQSDAQIVLFHSENVYLQIYKRKALVNKIKRSMQLKTKLENTEGGFPFFPGFDGRSGMIYGHFGNGIFLPLQWKLGLTCLCLSCF